MQQKFDTLEKIGNSIIQHGKINDRIYLMKLDKLEQPEKIIAYVDLLCKKNNYSKIFAKVPRSLELNFSSRGFKKEAYISGFYNKKEDILFMSKYFSPERGKIDNPEMLNQVLKTALNKTQYTNLVLPTDYELRILRSEDTEQMSNIYQKVFSTYPFPIHDKKYLQKTMQENIVYFGIFIEKKLAALSSCEMDLIEKNVEMTDFAVLPEHQGKKLAAYLLSEMEKNMKERNIKTAFTIARAYSYSMNITFARAGYKYSGTLIKNTNISGGLEDMNVWYKYL